MAARWIIYCLHNLREGGGRLHYIGRARTDQFRRRIQDHYGARGTRTTEDAIAAGAVWVLTSWLETDDPQSEHHENTRQSLLARCHLCNKTPGQERANQMLNAVCPVTRKKKGATAEAPSSLPGDCHPPRTGEQRRQCTAETPASQEVMANDLRP
jgi:hypothetical protein